MTHILNLVHFNTSIHFPFAGSLNRTLFAIHFTHPIRIENKKYWHGTTRESLIMKNKTNLLSNHIAFNGISVWFSSMPFAFSFCHFRFSAAGLLCVCVCSYSERMFTHSSKTAHSTPQNIKHFSCVFTSRLNFFFVSILFLLLLLFTSSDTLDCHPENVLFSLIFLRCFENNIIAQIYRAFQTNTHTHIRPYIYVYMLFSMPILFTFRHFYMIIA